MILCSLGQHYIIALAVDDIAKFAGDHRIAFCTILLFVFVQNNGLLFYQNYDSYVAK